MSVNFQQQRVGAPSEEVAMRIVDARKWVDANWRSNPSLEDVAVHADMSKFHFHRMFKRVTGRTLKHYVDQLRIIEAKRLLFGGMPIVAVVVELKFAHQSHFTSRFKQLVGQTPRRWVLQTRRAELNEAA